MKLVLLDTGVGIKIMLPDFAGDKVFKNLPKPKNCSEVDSFQWEVIETCFAHMSSI